MKDFLKDYARLVMSYIDDYDYGIDDLFYDISRIKTYDTDLTIDDFDRVKSVLNKRKDLFEITNFGYYMRISKKNKNSKLDILEELIIDPTILRYDIIHIALSSHYEYRNNFDIFLRMKEYVLPMSEEEYLAWRMSI